MADKDSNTRKLQLERDRAYAKRRRADGFILRPGGWVKRNDGPPSLDGETWKPVPGYEGLYLASDLGRIYSLRGMGSLLRPHRFKSWYPCVNLHRKDGTFKADTLHAWIALTFLGPTPEGFQINHKDGDKGNPRVSNLEFMTPLENVRHAVANGLMNNRGENHGAAVLSDEKVRAIRQMYVPRKFGFLKVGRVFGISSRHAQLVVRGTIWGHVK